MATWGLTAIDENPWPAINAAAAACSFQFDSGHNGTLTSVHVYLTGSGDYNVRCGIYEAAIDDIDGIHVAEGCRGTEGQFLAHIEPI